MGQRVIPAHSFTSVVVGRLQWQELVGAGHMALLSEDSSECMPAGAQLAHLYSASPTHN